jgi:FAD/FMN-containing dehydrogenase/Fe-S oxidoreductase
MQDPEREKLAEELTRALSGEVLFDEMTRAIYSTDASLYEVLPLGVVLPRSREDIVQTVRTAASFGVPILPRGGGTSLAGQTVTHGLIVDCSKHFNRILEVNAGESWAEVEPGIVLDELNQSLRPAGLFFSPDVATSSRANLGGMIGNNSCGVRSIRYGKTVDHVQRLSIVLATGEELLLEPLNRVQLERKCSQQDREGEIYRTVRRVVQENREEILRRYPKVLRRVGGYNLDALLDEERFNLSSLVVGSEGTLAFVTRARIHLDPIPVAASVAVLHFDDLLEAVGAVHQILKHQPSAVEILDAYGLALGMKNPAVAELCKQFVQGSPEAILIVEFSGSSETAAREGLENMMADSALAEAVYHFHVARTPLEQDRVWQVRKNALGVLLGTKGDAKPLPFIEDASVPVERLRDYIAGILDICSKHQRPLAMYAHASAGLIHVRPILNLKQAEDVEILQKISAEAFDLVMQYGGAWSGEHGDGLVRSYKNREFFGDRLMNAFREVKKAFDPHWLMNPGKIVDAPAMTENLRIHPGYRAEIPETYFRFEEEQGFDRAVEMCTGVGHCRKTTGGTMCPSYMATRDEEHSTRGRANALRLAMSGKLGPERLTGNRLYEALDLCLECKACKSECPSNVDMAKLKAEFLAHYFQRHGFPVGKRLVGGIRRAAETGSRFPSLFNLVSQNRIARFLLERFAGLDRRRTPPALASRTLTSLWQDFQSNSAADRPPVGLFADTFTNYYEPSIGIAAAKVLDELGFRVELLEGGCCGRPLISAGMLGQARAQGGALVGSLLAAVDRGLPIVVLEPGCFAALRDDLTDLAEDCAAARRVADAVCSLEEFLTRENLGQRMASLAKAQPDGVVFHGHCQQKALIGTSAASRLFSQLSQKPVEALDSGCCGMAGSFGYEKKHYEISEKIGERRLFPAVREAGPETPIVAPGFSCRAQIRHFTGKQALHPAEWIARLLGV